MKKINLAIIEDNQEILEALMAYFNSQEEITLVASAKSVESFTNKFNASLNIDVLLLDIMLEGINGIAGIPSIKKTWPDINIIINSVLEDHENIFSALQQGAVGYLTKETPLENIKNSIVQAKQGMSVMNSSIAGRIVHYFSSSNSEIKEKLTEKEMMVAEALKNGLSYKVIAIENGLSIDTIRFHVRNIYKKLHINSKGELIRMMMRR
jgi:DNA-binding NarL/FixJ family response regulator